MPDIENIKRVPAAHELTTDEVRSRFLSYVRGMIDYWEKESRRPDSRGKLEGLAHSILVALDGEAGDLPGFIVAPLPSAEDKAYLSERGEDWYPENVEAEAVVKGDIAGSLHDALWQGDDHV